MIDEIKHTELPWKYVEAPDGLIYSGSKDKIDLIDIVAKRVEPHNAKFIVRACTEYYGDKEIIAELLRELKNAKAIIEEYVPREAMGIDATGDLQEGHLTQSWPVLDEHLHYIDRAIAKAEGKPNE